MNKKDKLEHLLKGINHSYYDFVRYTMKIAERCDIYDELIGFIEGTQDVSTSAVLRYLDPWEEQLDKFRYNRL